MSAGALPDGCVGGMRRRQMAGFVKIQESVRMSTPADVRTATVFAEIAKERAAIERKTERLRALRLAKESEQRNHRTTSDAPAPKRKRKASRKTVRVNVPR